MKSEALQEIRVDKWLWTVRLFKSRTKANTACKTRKVQINGVNAKASSTIKKEDIVTFKKGNYKITVKVADILKSRRNYEIAKECYIDLTPASEYEKFKTWFYEAETSEFRDQGAGRPTKKDRRTLDDFKRSLHENDF